MAEKEDNQLIKLNEQIDSLTKQKKRIKDAYLSGVVEMEDFGEDLRLIDEKLNKLEQQKLECMEVDTQNFSLMKIMADRDVELENRFNSGTFIDDLKNTWNAMNKSEKQEFISKFIESMVLVKDDKNHSFIIQSINFRSRYVDELNKLQKIDTIDLAKPTADMQDVAIYRSMKMITEQERDEYLEHLKEHYDVKIYDDPYLWAYSYVENVDGSVISMPRQKGNERLIRSFLIDNDNPSGTSSFSNNAIQNSAQLSKVNKHNLRKYENNTEQIQMLQGSNNLFEDVQKLYLQEFEESRQEYNAKQTRNDRKIKNYFEHISKDKLRDLACEIVIELGDKDFWQDKDIVYWHSMGDYIMSK